MSEIDDTTETHLTDDEAVALKEVDRGDYLMRRTRLLTTDDGRRATLAAYNRSWQVNRLERRGLVTREPTVKVLVDGHPVLADPVRLTAMGKRAADLRPAGQSTQEKETRQ